MKDAPSTKGNCLKPIYYRFKGLSDKYTSFQYTSFVHIRGGRTILNNAKIYVMSHFQVRPRKWFFKSIQAEENFSRY